MTQAPTSGTPQPLVTITQTTQEATATVSATLRIRFQAEAALITSHSCIHGENHH